MAMCYFRFLTFFIFQLLFICNARAQTHADSVLVLPKNFPVPEHAQKLGSITAGNNVTEVHCDYEAMINEAKDKALELGGNIVKITQLVAPTFISKCYKIRADVYKTEQLPDSLYSIAHVSAGKATDDNKNSDHATIYIYRLKDSLVLEPDYNIHLDDTTIICRMKSKSRYSQNIDKEGEITLWAKKEKMAAVKLTVKKGESYYIRCGVTNGEFRMQPYLELVDNKTGEAEYGSEKKVKKDMNVNYLNHVH